MTQPSERGGDGKTMSHGLDCEKVKHFGEGHLHGSEDDRPYDVDGVIYCGRCHRLMGWTPVGAISNVKTPKTLPTPQPSTVKLEEELEEIRKRVRFMPLCDQDRMHLFLARVDELMKENDRMSREHASALVRSTVALADLSDAQHKIKDLKDDLKEQTPKATQWYIRKVQEQLASAQAQLRRKDEALLKLTIGTCGCNVKTPELKYHSETCNYRIAGAALDDVSL